MNVEYIGVDGAKLDDAFTSYNTLVNDFNNRLHNEEFVNEFITPIQREGEYFYRACNLCDQVEYKVEIISVHEEGLLIRLACLSDLGVHKGNIPTSAALIVKDNDVPKFIVDGIDAFVNKDFAQENDLIWSKANENIVSEVVQSLGQRIDEPFYVGSRPKDTILTKSHNEKKIGVIKQSIMNRLGSLSLYLDTIGKDEEQGLSL